MLDVCITLLYIYAHTYAQIYVCRCIHKKGQEGIDFSRVAKGLPELVSGAARCHFALGISMQYPFPFVTFVTAPLELDSVTVTATAVEPDQQSRAKRQVQLQDQKQQQQQQQKTEGLQCQAERLLTCRCQVATCSSLIVISISQSANSLETLTVHRFAARRGLLDKYGEHCTRAFTRNIVLQYFGFGLLFTWHI